MFRIDRSLVNIDTSLDVINPVTINSAEDRSTGLEAAAESHVEHYSALAEEILRKAAEEADLKRQRASMDSTEIKAQAWKEGFIKGKVDAEAAIALQEQENILRLKQMFKDIETAQDEMFLGFEKDVLELSLEIAKKIVNVAIENNDNIFESMVKNALNHMKREGKIVVKVNNREYEQFFASGSALFVLGDESINATIIKDPLLPEAGCIIESDGGTVNAGLDSQIKHIAIAFNQADIAND